MDKRIVQRRISGGIIQIARICIIGSVNHHIDLPVADLARSRAFHDAVLAPLGLLPLLHRQIPLGHLDSDGNNIEAVCRSSAACGMLR